MVTCLKCVEQISESPISCLYHDRPNFHSPFGCTRPVTVPQEFSDVIPLPHAYDDQYLRLWVRSTQGLQSLFLPQQKRLSLGRYDLGTTPPDVDLNPFNARELGVSRLHAVIGYTLPFPTLADLDSRNGTELNGLRVKAYEVHRLRHNDVICLGKLVIYVHL
jgi:hypothetical protein